MNYLPYHLLHEQARQFPNGYMGPEFSARLLVMWLKGGRPGPRRIAKLIADLQALVRAYAQEGDLARRDKVFHTLRSQLNKGLRHCKLMPQLVRIRGAGGQVSWTWRWLLAGSGHRHQLGGKLPGVSGGLVSFDEGDALQCVLKFHQEGLLSRVARCKQCNEWFYARSTISLFCKKACQQRHFRLSPQARAKRNSYMRDYRTRVMPLKRSGKVK